MSVSVSFQYSVATLALRVWIPDVSLAELGVKVPCAPQ